jgi:hypothetical protein
VNQKKTYYFIKNNIKKHVRQIIEDSIMQLNKYIKTIENGKATATGSVLLDNKISSDIGNRINNFNWD